MASRARSNAGHVPGMWRFQVGRKWKRRKGRDLPGKEARTEINRRERHLVKQSLRHPI